MYADFFTLLDLWIKHNFHPVDIDDSILFNLAFLLKFAFPKRV